MADLPSAGQLLAVEGILPNGTYYASLHTTDPSTTGANEVSGGSYARQSVTVASGVISGGVTFSGMPAITTSLWVGLWSAVTSGTFKWGDATASTTTTASAGATVDITSFTLGVS